MDTQHKLQTLEARIGRLARHWLVGNLLLAISYFLTGKLGILLAAPPGYASIVWPASGIALGWILLFGHRLLLGVVLGSFAVNITALAQNTGVGLLDSAINCFRSSSASMVWCMANSALCQSFIRVPCATYCH